MSAKTVIYYFTGTGNSLSVARKIAAALGDTVLVPVAVLKEQDMVTSDAARIGIVCPVYFSGLPAMVASFAGRLRPAADRYLFGIVTQGGSGGPAALRQLDGILRERTGRGLDAGFIVKMPGNYILMYEPPSGMKREKILAAANETASRIAADVQQCRNVPLPRSLLANLVHSLLYPRFLAGVHGEDRKFSVSDSCTSCRTCENICPAGNIRLVDGRPVWQHRCELCCACIHACPVQAIQAGKGTGGRSRYRNPEVTLTDLSRGGKNE